MNNIWHRDGTQDSEIERISIEIHTTRWDIHQVMLRVSLKTPTLDENYIYVLENEATWYMAATTVRAAWEELEQAGPSAFLRELGYEKLIRV